MKIALMTRCRNESFIHEFIAYYIQEGVDNIFIYDDNSIPGTYDKIDSKFIDKVTIINNTKFASSLKQLNGGVIDGLYQMTKSFDWVINVDVDEFVTSNDDKTIRTHLETTYKDVDRIKIPWVMMTRNGRVNNPASLLGDVTYRWNHDLKHTSQSLTEYKFRCYSEYIPCKSIFKPIKFKNCGVHNPYAPYDKKTIKHVDSVYNKYFDASPSSSLHYMNFNETAIENATLLCYHYRLVSEEHIMNKLEGSIYNFNIDKMLQYDYPELIDLRMREKAKKYGIIK
jgi:hypothetical protein